METAFGKILIAIGIVIVISGVLLLFKIPFLGQLPGDFVIKGNNYQIFIPIGTCVVLSIILSIIMYLFNHWKES